MPANKPNANTEYWEKMHYSLKCIGTVHCSHLILLSVDKALHNGERNSELGILSISSALLQVSYLGKFTKLAGGTYIGHILNNQ